MYLNHFTLKAMPFSITPDTGFFYQSPVHQEALNLLLVSIASGDGFIKLSGEVGTGKTLLCRKLLTALEADYETAYIPNPYLNPTALRMAIADELGLQYPRNLGQHRLLKLITERLVELKRTGRHLVLIIDEAQAMPDESLEALRLLSNLETEKEKLLTIVLFGQPELDNKLSQPKIRQLRQRILFSYRLDALNRFELRAYLHHRLQIAGNNDPHLFTPRAIRHLHRASRGIPRLINILGHKALMAAYGRGDKRILSRHVERAVCDTEDARQRLPWQRILTRLGAAAMLTGVSVFVWATTR